MTALEILRELAEHLSIGTEESDAGYIPGYGVLTHAISDPNNVINEFGDEAMDWLRQTLYKSNYSCKASLTSTGGYYIWICTRDAGHPGVHVAHGGRVCAVWLP